jgi:hypothetical protein
MATTDFAGFAKALGEGDRYWVADLAAADRLVLTEDGRRVEVEASLEKLRKDPRPAIPSYRTTTFSGLARALGCQPSYVTELKAAGRLVLTADGKRVRVDETLALIRETADPAKAGVADRHAAKRGGGGATRAAAPTAAVAGRDDGDDVDDDDEASTEQADPVKSSHARRKAKALADKAEADARKALRDEQVELGQLLQAEEVEHALRSAVVTFRGALENLPNTIAPELAAIDDEGRVRVVLAEALEHALEELARKFNSLGRAEA